MAGDRERVPPDEQVLVRLEPVHRVARANADDPSSVSTRTIVTAKERRGSGSHAASNGGSRGTTSRCSRTAVMRTTAVSPTKPRCRARAGCDTVTAPPGR